MLLLRILNIIKKLDETIFLKRGVFQQNIENRKL